LHATHERRQRRWRPVFIIVAVAVSVVRRAAGARGHFRHIWARGAAPVPVHILLLLLLLAR
jgi:hypothetical protein